MSRQLLLRRHDRTVLSAIEHLAGLQAQAPNPPYIGLWTRLKDFRFDALTQHLHDRSVVRCAAMRSTLHLLSADDLLAFRPLLQPVQLRGVQAAFGRKLAGLDMPALIAAGRTLLRDQAMTSAELGKRLSEHWPDRDAQAMAQAMRGHAALIHVPPAGTWDSHRPAPLALAETWLSRPLSTPASADDLIRRYLAAFGPASSKDLTVWSGLTGLGPALKRMHSALLHFRDEHGVELFDLREAPRPASDTPAPVRLLPEYDNLLLAHADRRRFIADEHRARVYTNNGIIRASVLIDGFVAGVWKLDAKSNNAEVRIDLFGRTSKQDRLDLEVEAMNLLIEAAPAAQKRDVIFGALNP
ncbi:winged helix DNA-binding domain-containing protein [Dyella subtropica]|uniref:winged helix DNA-binding domain-containing protein n=1 Tax=Dyella subtropica TaxID=2992127 RepID=UPI00224C9883|nr:winged helix DNA-binding domain-containing protein [Dyella subtropica]